MRRRSRRKRLTLLKLIAAAVVILIGIPLLFVYGVKVPWKARNVPMVKLWDVKNSQLLSMTLEEYVKGVVAAEMPAHFHLEALKAQAVVARTYAYQRIVNDVRVPDHPEAHLSTDYSTGQAWVSSDELKDRWGLVDYLINWKKISQAVAQTQGMIATYQGKPILAVYHSTSGGRTENSEHYWSEALPYLCSVADPYGNHSPYYYTTASFSTAKFLELMELDSLGKVQVLERYPSGRVKTMEAGEKWFSGRDVRQRLGLRSTWFTVHAESDQIHFSVWGYGHGVGMSQYGADGMARAGYDYRQILQYYYQGIALEKLY
ncbi:MAG: stage II sporulation protein D [Limnochordia bacterium]|jgi:stage II sporulation protein D|nr:stage II sporulation protein D [Bacillota bacterium]HOB09038.1 stage II sporulation protein D [Limnochordia bacterium]NLH30787.1 stage II sporulation protein D [Bacillota bacterium]HPT92873.1 stage II sporulation protein D [Limnochordia bacterium]HPZ31217.1 stage II sporulation protein D [Limnochordia bacterium]